MAWRKCQDNGQWTGEAPVCTSKKSSMIWRRKLVSPFQTLFGYVLQESLVQTLMTQNMAVFVSVALPQDPELITNATVDSSWREWHGESARTLGNGLERHQFARARKVA